MQFAVLPYAMSWYGGHQKMGSSKVHEFVRELPFSVACCDLNRKGSWRVPPCTFQPYKGPKYLFPGLMGSVAAPDLHLPLQ